MTARDSRGEPDAPVAINVPRMSLDSDSEWSKVERKMALQDGTFAK